METPKLPKFVTKLKTWIIVMGAITTTYAGAALVGLEVPRWTWISEHQALAGEVRNTRAEVYKSKVEHLENRHTDVLIAKQKVKPGTELYNTLFRKEKDLKRQLENAQAMLKKVRGF